MSIPAQSYNSAKKRSLYASTWQLALQLLVKSNYLSLSRSPSGWIPSLKLEFLYSS